jgi:L-malate glycosyltransferase
MGSMRIGVLCHDGIGGSTRVATDLAVGLAAGGHDVHLFAYSPPFGRCTDESGVTVHTVRPSRRDDHDPSLLYTDWLTEEIQALVTRIMDVIARQGLDVLHFHYAVPYATVIAELRRRLGDDCPATVGTLHGTDVTAHDRLSKPSRDRLVQALCDIDTLTTVSSHHAELSDTTFGLPVTPTVIPNFVDLTRFAPRAEDHGEPRTGAGIPTIVHVSNFRPVKRVQDVVEIFAGVCALFDAELWLVGDGEAMDDAKRFVDANGLSACVRFWGVQPDITEILPHADLMLITSQYESFSLAALEAMACGVPVLATEVGGLPEVLAPSGAGMLFPVGACDDAIELAGELLSAPERCRAMGTAGREHAMGYSAERVITQYEDLYRDLAGTA